MKPRAKLPAPRQDQLPTTAELLLSWKRHLVARNLAKTTVVTYAKVVRLLDEHCGRQGYPRQTALLAQAHIESFLGDLLSRGSPASAASYFIALGVYFKWCVEEGELTLSPMARMRIPKVPRKYVPVLTDDQIAKLLKACAGTDFMAKRDTAIIRFFLATGCRRIELVGLQLADVDLDGLVVRARLKGGASHLFPISRKTAAALDRYVRSRRDHKWAELAWLWLGRRGQLKYHAFEDLLVRRARAAGIGHIHAHLFRHHFNHEWLDRGGSENGLMGVVGWRTRSMIDRYGRSLAEKRARDEYHRLEPGDQF